MRLRSPLSFSSAPGFENRIHHLMRHIMSEGRFDAVPFFQAHRHGVHGPRDRSEFVGRSRVERRFEISLANTINRCVQFRQRAAGPLTDVKRCGTAIRHARNMAASALMRMGRIFKSTQVDGASTTTAPII